VRHHGGTRDGGGCRRDGRGHKRLWGCPEHCWEVLPQGLKSNMNPGQLGAVLILQKQDSLLVYH